MAEMSTLIKDEAALCYSRDPETDRKTGCIGHLRGAFEWNGESLFTSWWPHQEDRLNTSEFKKDINDVIDSLREEGGILSSLKNLRKQCYSHLDDILPGNDEVWGYRFDSDKYSYLMRLDVRKGNYNLYCYCYERDTLDKYLHKLTLKNIDETIYERYKIRWMDDHKITLEDLAGEIKNHITDSDISKEDIRDPGEFIVSAYKDWEQNGNGFDGMLWAGKEEFLRAEYLDEDYMRNLIKSDEEYNKWLSEKEEIQKDLGTGKEEELHETYSCQKIVTFADKETKAHGIFCYGDDTNDVLYIGRMENGDLWYMTFDVTEKEKNDPEFFHTYFDKRENNSRGSSSAGFEDLNEIFREINSGVCDQLSEDDRITIIERLYDASFEIYTIDECWDIVSNCETHDDISRAEEIIGNAPMDADTWNEMKMALSMISRDIYRAERGDISDFAVINEVPMSENERTAFEMMQKSEKDRDIVR